MVEFLKQTEKTRNRQIPNGINRKNNYRRTIKKLKSHPVLYDELKSRKSKVLKENATGNVKTRRDDIS